MYRFIDTLPTDGAKSTSMSIQTIFNGINLDEELTDDQGSFTTLATEGRRGKKQKILTIPVTGADGVVEEQNPTIEPLEPEVKFRIRDKTNKGFGDRLTRLRSLLSGSKKELKFTDEDVLLYATVDVLEIPIEDSNDLICYIRFFCSDPYKYGPEQRQILNDIDIIENKGTAPSDPIFELTAKKKATFAMISLGADEDSEYNLIGTPADVDEVLVDDRVTVINERGDTLNTWTETGTKFDSVKAQVSGELGTDGTGILPLSYGTPSSDTTWYGPALLKEINPIQDFEVEMRMRAESKRPDQVYRIEFYLFDENMNVLGKMGVWDSSTARAQFAGEGRVGPFAGAHVNYPISSRNYQHNNSHFHGMARMRRIGQRFEFYIARLRTGDSETGLHYDTITQVFNDALNEHQGRLKYVQIHIGTHEKGRPASVPRINNIKVTELRRQTVDQTPYILYPGDKVTFDHKDDDLLINGEPRNDLKNFGGSFFKLKKGFNNVVVTPSDAFDTSVKYRDRYL